MNTNYYATFFVVIDGKYYYGDVKTRSMMNVANQYLAAADNYEDTLITLLNAMKDLYNATVAFNATQA